MVAEGVEEVEQMRLLVAMGCDLFQGYLFSKPLSAKDFAAFIDDSNLHPPIAELAGGS